MKPIIRWTLWERKWSTIWWSVGIALYAALNILVYSSISSETASLSQALSKIPKTVDQLFTTSGSFITPAGYLDSKLFYLILPVLFTILLVGLARFLLANEEQNGTLELLLARPISRARLITAKLLSGLIILLIVGGAAVLSIFVCCQLVHIPIPTTRLCLAAGLSLLLSLLFGMVAFTCGAIGRKARTLGTGLTAVVFLASYLSSSLSSLAHWLTYPARVLPYHFYGSGDVLTGTYHWWRALVFIAAIVVLLVISYMSFARRDIG